MITQTVFKAGNSGVVSIPSDVASEYGYKIGLQVQVVPSGHDDDLIIKKVKKNQKSKSKIALEFNRWLRTSMVEDKEILDELA